MIGILTNLLRAPITALHARSLLAYLTDMSRNLLRGALCSGSLMTVWKGAYAD